MISEVEHDKIFNYWWEDLKWSGVFRIRWVYVRDIHHSEVAGNLVNGVSVISLKDGVQLPFYAGK